MTKSTLGKPTPGRYHMHVTVSKTGRVTLNWCEHYTPSQDWRNSGPNEKRKDKLKKLFAALAAK